MKDELKKSNPAAETTVSVYLHPENIGPYLEGAINGCVFRIPTGRVVEVSARIAAVIRESQSALVEGEQAVSAFRGANGRKLG